MNRNRIKYVLCAALCAMFLSASVIEALAQDITPPEISLTSDKTEADVGETIIFYYTIIDLYGPPLTRTFINFGDGSGLIEIAVENGSIAHSYANEGTYLVTFIAQSVEGGSLASVNIDIINYAPEFDITIPSSAYEDEMVDISVSDLVESLKDRNNLIYLWNFGDGTQINDSSSTNHTWTDAGEYPVTLTVIDDQGALNSETKFLEIQNKDPVANFTYGMDIPSTYDFRSDPIGAPPSGWNNSVGENSTIQVINWKDGRMKVVELNDQDIDFDTQENNGAVMEFQTEQYDEEKYGTIEFWAWFSNASNEFIMYAQPQPGDYIGEVDHRGFRLRCIDNKWQGWIRVPADESPYYKFIYTNLTEFEPVQSETWYHVRFDFHAASSGPTENNTYMGLQDHQFRVYINGKPSKIYNNSIKYSWYVGLVGFRTDFPEWSYLVPKHYSGYQCYIDSVGFSWDLSYEIGDNWVPFSESYKGTHDFRTVPKGELPDYPWTFTLEEKCSAQIVSQLGEHSDVLEISDQNDNGLVEVNLSIYEQPSYGTIEFWFRTEDKTKEIRLWGGNYFKTISIRLSESGTWEYETSVNGWLPIQFVSSPENNEWYHIRIDFECTNGGYMGLEKQFFYFYFNGARSPQIPFKINEDYVNIIGLQTNQLAEDYSIYLDAFGLSWDPNYNIGDNLYPSTGFYDKSVIIFTADRSYDTPSDIAGLKYFWDFGDNQTDYGMGVEHRYQKSGNYIVSLRVQDDNGAIDTYEEEIIIDNTPPEIKILPPYHEATYNFKDDPLGSVPEGWWTLYQQFAEWLNVTVEGDPLIGDGKINVTIVELLEGHRKVLAFDDRGSVSDFAQLSVGEMPIGLNFSYNPDYNGFNQTSGTVEFWGYFTDPTQTFYISLYQIFLLIFGDGLYLKVDDNGLYYCSHLWTGWTQIEEVGTIESHSWYHFRIDFSCDDSGYMGLGENQWRVALNDKYSSIYELSVSEWPNLEEEFSETFDMYSYNWTILMEFFYFLLDIDPEDPYPIDYLKSINQLSFRTEDDSSGYQCYIDAVGFSWDPNYDIGDNYVRPLILNEGETLVLETTSSDTLTDLAQLQYHWDLGDGWDPERNGRREPFLWSDNEDFENIPIVMIEDPETAKDYSYMPFAVYNVEPHINLDSVYVGMNASMEVTGPNHWEANFYLEVIVDNETTDVFYVNKPPGYHSIEVSQIPIELDFSKKCELFINRTRPLEVGTYWVSLTLTFSDGSSYELNQGFNVHWPEKKMDPAGWRIDLTEYISAVPLTLGGSVFDPSNDDIQLSVDQKFHSLLQIDHSSELNYSKEILTWATYDFENDEVGEVPEGWSDVMDIEGIPPSNPDSVRVIGALDGHHKVVEISDNSDVAPSYMWQNFEDPQSQGTIEFWIRSSKVFNMGELPVLMCQLGTITEAGGAILAALAAYKGYFVLSSSDWRGDVIIVNLTKMEPNKWYHIRWDFNWNSENYMGLGESQSRIIIDNEISGAGYFMNVEYSPENYTNFLWFSSSFDDEGYNINIDDIGYSWDPEYIIGANKGYESELKTKISYDFENDEVDSVPLQWFDAHAVFGSTNSDSVRVIESLGGRNSVVEIYDDSTEKSSLLAQYLNDNLNFGTVDFWIRTNDVTSLVDYPIFIAELGSASGSMRYTAGGLAIYDGWLTLFCYDEFYVYQTIPISVANSNQWYYCSIDFEYTTGNHEGLEQGQIKLTIDNTSYAVGDLVNYQVNPNYNYLEYFAFWTSEDDSELSVYVDDMNYSWQPYYYVENGGGFYEYFYYDEFLVESDIGILNCSVEIRPKDGYYAAEVIASRNVLTEYYYDTTFPVDIPFTFPASPLRWVVDDTLQAFDVEYFLSNLVNLENLAILYTNYSNNFFEINALDDDGGKDSTILYYDPEHIENIGPQDLGPKIELSFVPEKGAEDSELFFFINVTNYDPEIGSITFNFGDNYGNGASQQAGMQYNGSVYYGTHIYQNEGTYLVTITVCNGAFCSKMGFLIQIENAAPNVNIKGFVNGTEDSIIQFESTFSDSDSDLEGLRFYWDFGDGSTSYDENPSHAWSRAGIYNVTLYVIDDNGESASVTRQIHIWNEAPTIEGPLTFYAVEGEVIVLDVATHDSNVDEWNLNYVWNFEGQMFYERKPSLYLDDGNYTITLTITDNKGLSTTVNISLIVENVAPMLFAQSKMYYGPPAEIELNAYAVDSFLDTEDFYFVWTIFYGETPTVIGDEPNDVVSTISYSCENTTTLKGYVTVIDDCGKLFRAEFQIRATMDTNGDGLTDEFERQFHLDPDKIDADYDGLLNVFEVMYYGTNMSDPDTDDDGLWDGYNATHGVGEYGLGTDPLDPDTDDDTLLDGFEWFGWNVTFQRDVGEGYITVWTSSDPLKFDTDGDGLSDLYELVNGTNPNNEDTDFDGLSDPEEYSAGTDPLNYDSDGDGLTDGAEILGIRTRWGLVSTNATKTDTDDDGLSDYEEVNGIKNLYPTHPRLSDTDGDGLLDSQEIYTVKRSLNGKMEIENLGLGRTQTYSFVFPKTEYAVSAQATVSVSAGEGQLAKTLTYSVYLNSKLLYSSETPIVGENYYVNITDVKSLIERVSPAGYGGTWDLYVAVDYGCLLEEFSLDVSGYLNPLDPDTDDDGIMDGVEVNPELNNGWVTEPTNPDTDGDGWSDYTEIHSTITSPLSSDTDGDGVNDPADMAPLQNLIVKVTIKKAHKETSWLEWTPKMQVVVRDVERDSAVFSTKKWADQDQRSFWFFIWFNWYTTAEWGEGENDFYFDVDDDDYSFEVEASAYYQVLGFLWDEEFLKTTYSYAPTGVGHSQDYYYESTDEHSLSLRFESVGISRVNTIAAYANGSYYHGTYSAQEKMAVVQLDVSGSSTNFDSGANVILIPTSVFTNTKLHAVVEKAVDADGTVDWDSLPDCLKGDSEFVGIDRNNLDDTASEWIEFTITKSGCSPADAEAILLLALTSANESEGVIYLCDAGSTAELMNLPGDILSVVPLYAAGIVNDEQGEKPTGLWDWVVQLITNPLQALWNLICAIGEWLGKLIEAIVEAGMRLVESIVPGAMALIKAAIKAAILIFAYIMFAITLAMVAVGFLAIIAIIALMSVLLGASVIVEINSIEIQKENVSAFIGYYTGMETFAPLDLDVPTVYIYFTKGSTSFLILFNLFGITTTLPEPTEDFYGTAYDNPTTGLKSNSEWTDEHTKQLLNGMAAMMAFMGSWMGIIGGIAHSGIPQLIAVSLGLMIFSLGLFIYGVTLKGVSICLVTGMALGFLISAGFALAAEIKYWEKGKKLIFSIFGLGFAITSIILSFFGFAFLELALIVESGQFGLGFVFLLLGMFAIMAVNKKDLRNIIALAFAFISIACGLFFIVLPLFNPLPII